MKKILLILFISSLFYSCTDNQSARMYGGTERIDVTKGEKVVTVTFKEYDLWILTRPAKPEERADTLIFKEKSSFGILEGTIYLQESK